MTVINEFIQTYGTQILLAAFTAITGFVGTQIKKLYEKYITDMKKKQIVKTCVKAVEQVYRDLKGQDKFNKAKEYITAMMNEEGIQISDIELTMLIESTVAELNFNFGTPA